MSGWAGWLARTQGEGKPERGINDDDDDAEEGGRWNECSFGVREQQVDTSIVVLSRMWAGAKKMRYMPCSLLCSIRLGGWMGGQGNTSALSVRAVVATLGLWEYGFTEQQCSSVIVVL